MNSILKKKYSGFQMPLLNHSLIAYLRKDSIGKKKKINLKLNSWRILRYVGDTEYLLKIFFKNINVSNCINHELL